MRRLGAWLLSLVVACALHVLPASAQSAPSIDIRPPTPTTGTAIAVRSVLSDKPFEELLRNGFPTSIRFRAEVWTKGRWFDDVVARVEWEVRISYDVIDRTFDVARLTREGAVSLGNYAKFADARAASELAFTPSLALPAGKRGYVAVQVDVQTVDMSDLAEMQRWLQGEARPAVQGRRNPGTALTRGLRTLVTRLLGGEVLHFERRSAVMQF
jgi:hypothetical protein